MFRQLEKKLKRTLFLLVVALLCFSSIMAYKLFPTILLNDFAQKSEQVSRQIAKSIEIRLTDISETVDLLMSKYPLSDVLNNPHGYGNIIGWLREFVKYNDSISGVFLITDGDSGYVTMSEYNVYINELPCFDGISDMLGGNETQWLYLTSESVTKKRILLLSLPVHINDGELYGYLFVEADIAALSAILERHENIFFEESAVYFVFSDESTLLLSQENDVHISDSDLIEYATSVGTGRINKGDVQITGSSIGLHGIHMVACTRSKYIENQTRLIIFILSSFVVLCSALSYFCVRYITGSIISQLENLRRKMDEHIIE